MEKVMETGVDCGWTRQRSGSPSFLVIPSVAEVSGQRVGSGFIVACSEDGLHLL